MAATFAVRRLRAAAAAPTRGTPENAAALDADDILEVRGE
jgi:hypothetical protein